MALPLVSVCMPAWNSSRHIAEAIQSAIEGQYPHWELVVVDDGSDDETAAVVEGLKNPRIKLHCLPQHVGNNMARNQALAMASGEYVAWLDSDDTMLPQRLSLQVEYLQKHPKADAVQCYGTYSGRRRGTLKVPWQPEYIKAAMQFNNCIFQPGLLMRRRLIEPPSFRYSPEWEAAGDYRIYYDAIMQGHSFHTLRIPLVKYRVWEGQIGQRKKNLRESLQMRFLQERVARFSPALSMADVEALYAVLRMPFSEIAGFSQASSALGRFEEGLKSSSLFAEKAVRAATWRYWHKLAKAALARNRLDLAAKFIMKEPLPAWKMAWQNH